MAVTVRISETYDLHTKRNKIGLLGIHTPPRELIAVHYAGLMQNHKKMRFLGCNVAFASASTLPLDPLNIADDGELLMHPADIMNPVLYKAVSNDSFDALTTRIYGAGNIQPSSTGSSLVGDTGIYDDPQASSQNPWTNFENDFDVYYGILSTENGFKKMPQQAGFTMKNLTPLAYPLLSQFGNVNLPQGNDPRVVPAQREPYKVTVQGEDVWTTDYPNTSNQTLGRYFRGRAVRCPALPLWSGWSGGNITTPKDATLQPTTFPVSYVGAIIVPPCHNTGSVMFYRLRITWTIRFEQVCSSRELMPFFGGYNYVGQTMYWSDYDASQKMEKTGSLVDSSGFDIEKVMD